MVCSGAALGSLDWLPAPVRHEGTPTGGNREFLMYQ